MREIQASEAKAHLSRLLNEVEHGETILITRHGRAITPVSEALREHEIREAVENIKALGKEIAREHGPASIEEIISSIREGHKYSWPSCSMPRRRLLGRCERMTRVPIWRESGQEPKTQPFRCCGGSRFATRSSPASVAGD